MERLVRHDLRVCRGEACVFFSRRDGVLRDALGNTLVDSDPRGGFLRLFSDGDSTGPPCFGRVSRALRVALCVMGCERSIRKGLTGGVGVVASVEASARGEFMPAEGLVLGGDESGSESEGMGRDHAREVASAGGMGLDHTSETASCLGGGLGEMRDIGWFGETLFEVDGDDATATCSEKRVVVFMQEGLLHYILLFIVGQPQIMEVHSSVGTSFSRKACVVTRMALLKSSRW